MMTQPVTDIFAFLHGAGDPGLAVHTRITF
jgi:hypothetical protein